MIKKIKNCRSCKSVDLTCVFSLGSQAFSGVFKPNLDTADGRGPLELFWCRSCNLVQLGHIYSSSLFFTQNYGYSSGATKLMKLHLREIVDYASNLVSLSKGDLVLDIGCNDGTLLNSYEKPDDIIKIGFDPVSARYLRNFDSATRVLPDFFSEKKFFSVESKLAKIVTSISMFYDLEDPVSFARDVSAVLESDGVWVFEQSYLFEMLRKNSYDTICHEHVSFYCLAAIENILAQANLRVFDVSMNELNGGSIRVVAVKRESNLVNPSAHMLNRYRTTESSLLGQMRKIFMTFSKDVEFESTELTNLLKLLKDSGKTVIGYGASTKGNVILQNCGIDVGMLRCIGDITPHKTGMFTPGSNIPIVSMEDAKKLKPDFYLVLPWSFKQDILNREAEELARGAKFIFPLPRLEIVG